MDSAWVARYIKNKLFFFVSGEIENETIPGVTWKPSTDGVSNADQKISRTLESDMVLVKRSSYVNI